jgi:hypothetical protein
MPSPDGRFMFKIYSIKQKDSKLEWTLIRNVVSAEKENLIYWAELLKILYDRKIVILI